MPIEDGFGDVEAESSTQTEQYLGEDNTGGLTDGSESDPVKDAPTEAEPVADDQSGDEVPAEDPVESSGLSDMLVREAKNVYGLNDDDLTSYQTDDDLSRQLGAIDRLALQRLGEQQQQQPPDPQSPQEPTTTQDDEQKAWTPQKLEMKLGEDFEPEVAELLDKINEHYHSQMMEQQKMFQQEVSPLKDTVSNFQDQQDAAYEKQLDDYFTKMPDQYKEVFGEGSIRSLQQGSQQWENRRQWEQDYQTQVYMDMRAGRPVSEFDEYTDRVTRARWGNISDQATRHEIRQQAATQRRKGINRPASTQTKKGTPEEIAADNANRFYSERDALHPSTQQYRNEF